MNKRWAAAVAVLAMMALVATGCVLRSKGNDPAPAGGQSGGASAPPTTDGDAQPPAGSDKLDDSGSMYDNDYGYGPSGGSGGGSDGGQAGGVDDDGQAGGEDGDGQAGEAGQAGGEDGDGQAGEAGQTGGSEQPGEAGQTGGSDPDPAGSDAEEPDDPDREVIEIDVGMVEFAFSPSTIEVPVGAKVVLNLVNNGGLIHNLRFTDPTVGADSRNLAGGESQTLEFIANTPDTFSFICGQPGHESQGMAARLIVR